MSFVGIKKLSLLDYPGKVACILFTNKCNFYCPFCHNGLTLLPSNDFLPFEDILTFLKSRKGVLDGVVITGGEPTLLPDLIERISDIKKLGYLVKLDTNGSHPEVVKRLLDLKLIDYIAMDIKNSLENYSNTIGKVSLSLDTIKESINLIKTSGIEYEFRTTLVKEFHDEQSISDMAKLLKGSKALFLQKFVVSDGVINKNLHQIDEDLANKFVNILRQYIDKVELRGYSNN